MQAVQALRDVFEINQTHVISEKDNMLYLDDTLLIVHHKSGDVDTIDAREPHMQQLVASLYDLYQTADTIHAGDQFSLNGKIVAKCVDVHVVAVQETAVVLLTNYTFMPEDIAMLDRDFNKDLRGNPLPSGGG